jgi:hypothetical protein
MSTNKLFRIASIAKMLNDSDKECKHTFIVDNGVVYDRIQEGDAYKVNDIYSADMTPILSNQPICGKHYIRTGSGYIETGFYEVVEGHVYSSTNEIHDVSTSDYIITYHLNGSGTKIVALQVFSKKSGKLLVNLFDDPDKRGIKHTILFSQKDKVVREIIYDRHYTREVTVNTYDLNKQKVAKQSLKLKLKGKDCYMSVSAPEWKKNAYIIAGNKDKGVLHILSGTKIKKVLF